VRERRLLVSPTGPNILRRRELRSLAAALLAVVAGSLPVFLTASLAGQIEHNFVFGAELLGLSVALFHLTGVVVSPLTARLLQRTGVSGALRLSAVLAGSVSLSIAIFASSATQLSCLLMVAGVSNGVAGPAASVLLRQTVAARRHGLAFGTQQAGAPAAILLAGLAVPLVAVPLGWRWAFLGAGGIAAAATLAVPTLPRQRTRPLTTGAPRRRSEWSVLALLVIAAAAASSVGVAMVSFLVVCATGAGLSASAAGLLLGAVSLAAMIGRITFGLRVDHGRSEPLSTAFSLMIACTIGVTLLVANTPISIVLGALIIGGLGWTWHGVLMFAIVQHTRDAPVWAVGMLMSGVFVGAILGPLLVGTISTAASFQTAWVTCAALSLIPLVAVALARRQSTCRPDPHPAPGSSSRKRNAARAVVVPRSARP